MLHKSDRGESDDRHDSRLDAAFGLRVPHRSEIFKESRQRVYPEKFAKT